MSRSRDRLGLLLPLPALLAAGPQPARAEEPQEAPAQPASAEDPPLDEVDLGAAAPPDGLRAEAKAAFERGTRAFTAADYKEAAAAFDHAAGLAPDLPELWVNVVISLRRAVFAEVDPDVAMGLCMRLREYAKAVSGRDLATPEMIERVEFERDTAEERCAEFESTAGPCLTVIEFEPCLVAAPIREIDHGPCLKPPYDPEPKGCAHRRGDVAMLGLPLLLLGLRSRRRRDALDRMADRLPPDVLARLRREEPGSDDSAE